MQASSASRQSNKITRFSIYFLARIPIYIHTRTRTHKHAYVYIHVYIYKYAGEHSVEAVVPD